MSTAPTQSSSTIQATLFKERRAIFLVLMVAAGLYFYQLDGTSLWLDEFNSLYDAQRLPEEINATRPLYYILLRIWMVVSTGTLWLRGLSVVFGLGSVALLYELGRQIAGNKIGCIAALLLACSPLFINHVQEVRMYALGNFLSLAGCLLLLKAIERPKLTVIASWAISRLLATLTTPLSILLLLPDAVIILWQFRRRVAVLVRFAAGYLFIGAGLVPSAITILTKSGPAFASSWTAELAKPGLAAIVSKLTSFTAFWPLASLPKLLPIKAFYAGYTLAMVVLMAIALLQLTKQSRLGWVAAWGFLPAGMMLLVSYLVSPIWNGRYLLFLSPHIFILLAVGFVAIWQRYRTAAIALTLCYVLAVGGGLNQYYHHWNRDAWGQAIEVIQTEETPGDAIAVYAPLKDPRIAVNYYYEGDAPVSSFGPFKGEINEQSVMQALSTIPKSTDVPNSSNRLWIVYRGINGNAQANRLVHQAIEAKYQVQQHQKFDGPIDLYLASQP